MWFETTTDVTAGEEIFGGADTDPILVSGGNSDVFDFRGTLIQEVETIEFDAISATARTVQLDDQNVLSGLSASLLIDGNGSFAEFASIEIFMQFVSYVDISG